MRDFIFVHPLARFACLLLLHSVAVFQRDKFTHSHASELQLGPSGAHGHAHGSTSTAYPPGIARRKHCLFDPYPAIEVQAKADSTYRCEAWIPVARASANQVLTYLHGRSLLKRRIRNYLHTPLEGQQVSIRAFNWQRCCLHTAFLSESIHIDIKLAHRSSASVAITADGRDGLPTPRCKCNCE